MEAEGPRAVLAGIPGWQDARCRELSGGLTNRTYFAECEGKRGVLKIDAVPRSAPYNTRFEEARIQKRAARIGLANDVLYVGDDVYLSQYVDGKVWTPADLARDENLVDLAFALQRLHAMPLAGRDFDARSAAQHYLGAIGARDRQAAERHVAVVDSMPPPQRLCCCHNDLVAANILSVPEIRFLDWEYACDNDPLFDLATVVAHHRLSGEQAELLLDTYFDGDGKRWRTQLAEQERMYEALCWLWAAAMKSGQIELD